MFDHQMNGVQGADAGADLDEYVGYDCSPENLAEQERISFELWEQQYRTPEGQLGQIVDCARGEAMSAGAKLHAVAEFIHLEMAKVAGQRESEVTYAARSAQCEVGLALHVSTQSAGGLVDLALALSRRLPRTLDALRIGRITLPVARMLSEETANLTVAQAAQVETAILPKAAERTPGSLQKSTRSKVQRLDADAVRKRRERALTERDVRIQETHDGMASLAADMPLETAWEIKNLIEATAAQKAPGDTRKIGERRVDALADLILRPDDESPRTAVVLHLHAGAGEDATAIADGFGALDSEAATAAADLVVAAPTGPTIEGLPFDVAAMLAELNAGANDYVPSPKLARAIRARDKHCRFPGCRMPASRCELDHTIKFRLGGRTVTFNLACLCKFHHRIKDEGAWICTQNLLGRLTWSTPNGQTYVTDPTPRFGEPPPDFQSPKPQAWPHATLRQICGLEPFPGPYPDRPVPF